MSSFTLERSTDQVNWSPLTTLPGTARSYTDNTTPAPTFFYRLTGYTAQGQTVPYNFLQVNAPAGPDNDPPVVTFLAPSEGSTVSGTISIQVNVKDNQSCNKVQFYVQNLGAWQLIAEQPGTGANANYSQSLDTTTIANASTTLLVRAYDNAGNGAYSLRGITINNFNADPGTMDWAYDVGKSPQTGECQITSTAVDSAGNILVCGIFSSTINFSGTTIVSNGGYDVLLAKFNTAGSLVWVKHFGGQYDSLAKAIGVDASGNIAIAGYFVDKVNFGGGDLVSGGGNSSADIFVAKFDPNGNHLWSKVVGGQFGNYASNIAVDHNGDVVISGQCNGPVNLGGGSLSGLGGTDGYVAKYSSGTGAYIWAKRFGGLGYDVPQGLCVDASNNVYVSGYTTGDCDFGGGTRPNNGGGDAFMVRYAAANGAHTWSRMIGGNGNESAPGLTIDSAGNGAICLTFTGTLSVDGFLFQAPQSSAMVVATFEIATGNLLHARSFGGQSSIGGGLGPVNITTDANYNVILTGVATGEADFGNGQLTSGSGNIFIAKYTATQGYIWAKRFGASGWSAGLGIAANAAREIIACGAFAGSVDFDAVHLSTISAQIKDGYLLKVGP